jgi:predicted outer membrane repeat protein
MYEGGAIYVNSAASITNCSFTFNKAGFYWFTYTERTGGGAIYCNVQPGQGLEPTIRNSVFYDNDANAMGGGALFITGASATVENCIFSGNKAGYGGAIYTLNQNWGIAPVVRNSVFYQNSASYGGAIADYNYSYMTITNSILWDNAAPNGPQFNDPTLATVTYSDVAGGFQGVGNIVSDPLFVDSVGRDFRLTSGSPCIDAGTPTGAPPTDIEGTPRPQGNGYDMGAYEYH